MAGLPSIPSLSPNAPAHTVSTRILIAGRDVTQNPGGLLSLSIHKELNRIPSATIILADGAMEKGTFAKSGSSNFAPGQVADIQLGYQSQTESIFKGLIVKHGIKASPHRPSTLELECKDPTIRMTLLRRSRYFIEMKDTDIIRQIIESYAGAGISIGNIADTGFAHPEMVQYHCTDWDFMLMRAEANGLAVLVNEGKVSIVKPEASSTADFDITWGGDIIDMEAEIDARTHFADISASTWDYVNGKVATEKGSGNTGALGGAAADVAGGLANAASAVGDALGIDLGIEDETHRFPDVFYKSQTPQLFHGGDMATQELSAWAKSRQKWAELSQVRGRVQVRGRNFKPMQTMALKKVAGRFNGSHLVTGVMHQLHSGTWEADIQFGMSNQTFAQSVPDITMPDAAGLVPSIQGLHIGIVTKIEGDVVKGNHRIKVKIPFIAAQGGSNDGIWARLATISAGPNRGFVFRPELGDEVILGFINNDPNDAILLGSLHSNKNTAPLESKDKNPQQGFFAKNGMTLVFDDDKKSIELKTKEGYSILVSEGEGKIEIKDKNNNSVKLSSAGIDLESQSAISIKAKGKISIKGAEVRLNDPF